MRNRIQLKNSHDLMIESNLEEVLAGSSPDWRERGISLLVLLADEDRPEVLRLVETARDAGLVVRIARPEPDFEALENLRKDLVRELHLGKGLLLGSNEGPLPLETFVALLLVSFQKKSITPAEAVRLASGRETFTEADLFVYEFKKYLDPDFTVPVQQPSPQPVLTPADRVRPAADLLVETDAKDEGPAVHSPTANLEPAPAVSAQVPETSQPVPPSPAQPAPPRDEPAPQPPARPAPQPPAQPARPAPAAVPASAARDEFHASRFTIRVKLISITSGIIVAALGTMILAASYFFRRAMVTSVQENNLVQATVIGSRVETELRALESGARLLVTGGGAGAIRDEFFKSNPGIIFVGTAGQENGNLKIRRSIFNATYMTANNIKEDDFYRLHDLNGKFFLKSFNGATVFQNISPGFVVPVLGLSTNRVPGEEILLVYLDAENFLKVFSAGESENPEDQITRTFMVNSLGEVIAHPDPARVLSRSNLADIEIVQEFLRSTVVSGQKTYEDEAGRAALGSYRKIAYADLGVISTAEEARVLEPVYWIQWSNILITLMVLALAILIVYYVARSLSVPIVRLVGATKEVEQGHFEVSIQPASGDEVGVLTSSFVRMAQGLSEREKLKGALGKFVNPEIAERALRGELVLGGEGRKAAVFFSDLRGFTAMSEGMTPEEVVEVLNEYFTAMVACVDATGGVVDKFIGDAIMAHWGAIPSPGNDTENAITSALLMRRALIDFNARNKGRFPFIKMGSGINTGQVISGNIGSENRLDFTVIGDAVNLASRIEALNKPFGTDVLISTDAYNEVRDIFAVEEMPAIKVKGKSEPQTIYAVLGRKDDPACPGNMDEVRAALGIEYGGGPKTEGGVLKEDKEEKFEILEK